MNVLYATDYSVKNNKNDKFCYVYFYQNKKFLGLIYVCKIFPCNFFITIAA